MTTLYIIGNGFDIHHGLKSSYWNFRNYVEEKDKELFVALEKYFNPDQLWSDFEGALANFDIDQIRDEAGNYLVSYSAEDWSDSGHHDYQYEISKRVEIVTELLRQKFLEWVLNLEIPNPAKAMVNIQTDSVFLNFNYTNTLQRLYKIEENKINYIHNQAKDIHSILILGHSRKPNKKTPSLLANEESIDDVRITEGEDILDQYFIDTYKPTETIINDNHDFFSKLSSIDTVIVLGHSLSRVDLPYFDKVIKHVDVAKTAWKVSYYNEKEKEERKKVLLSLGIPEDMITIDRMESFNSLQPKLF